ncbi:MAG: hypothetical protein JRJ84_25590 [Deltaproteobacteria bacterium]|nr:hypothetical protein [Deltaproteobacteria bacterium]
MKAFQTARGQGEESSPGIQEYEAPVPTPENSVMQEQLAGGEDASLPGGNTPTLDAAANDAGNSVQADSGSANDANEQREGGGIGLLGGGGTARKKKLNIVPFTVADGGARTSVGVGEKMIFHCNEAGTTWSATKGTGTTTRKSGFVDQFKWTAPNKKGNATISVTTSNGAGNIKIKVVEPSSMTASVTGSYPVTGTGAGMKLKIVFNPTTVNFQYLQWREAEANATNISGYFNDHTPPNHDRAHGAGRWLGIGNKNNVSDNAYFGYTWTPYKAGTYDWPITNQWRVRGDSAVNDLVSMKQEHEIFNTGGTAEVRKHGQKAKRTP